MTTVPRVYGKHLIEVIGSPKDFPAGEQNPNDRSYLIPPQIPELEKLEIEPKVENQVKPEVAKTQSQKKDVKLTSVTQRSYASSKDYPNEAFMPLGVMNLFSTDWMIKVRVVEKSEVRSWQNDRGCGKLINFVLADRAGTLI